MIHKYGIKIRGVSHDKDNSPCQDAYKIDTCGDDLVIAAVADGLGSCEHSDIASQTAVDTAVKYCVDKITPESNADKILGIIEESFTAALDTIEERAETDGNAVNLYQYYTTLSLSVFCNNTLYYGHSGDSGILALTSEGLYECVTEQQQDDAGNVFPLHFQDRWIFKQFDKQVSSVLMTTDGVLLRLCPPLLAKELVNIYVDFASYLMDNRFLRIDERGREAVEKVIECYIKDIVKQTKGLEFNSDDLTIVGLINTLNKPESQPEDYYKEPDWEGLKRKFKEEYEKEQRERYSHSGNKPEPLSADKSVSDSGDTVPTAVSAESDSIYGLAETVPDNGAKISADKDIPVSGNTEASTISNGDKKTDGFFKKILEILWS